MARVQVQISIDEELLKRVDDYADMNYTSRSGVFTQGAAQLVNAAAMMKAVGDMALSMQKIADSGVVDEETKKELEGYEALFKVMSQNAK